MNMLEIKQGIAVSCFSIQGAVACQMRIVFSLLTRWLFVELATKGENKLIFCIFKHLTLGVSQGSVFGSIFFKIYVNDMLISNSGHRLSATMKLQADFFNLSSITQEFL